MAMINRIRKRSGLLIIVIGGAMVAFILGGLLRQGGCKRRRPQKAEVGTIYGEGIPEKAYEKEVGNQIQRLRRRRQEELSEGTKQRIRDQVWNRMVRERLFQKHVEELDIEVPSKELEDLLAGQNVHPQIRRLFKQRMGTFNKDMVLRQIQRSYKKNKKARKQWTRMAQGIVQDRAFTKFRNLVKKGMFANQVELKNAYRARQKKVDLKYVLRPYRSLKDDKLDLKEADVRSYYQKHKDDPEYEQEASRSFKYALVDAGPSQKDIEQARKDMKELKQRFKEADRDSLFAANQSDKPGVPIEFLRKGELGSQQKDSLLFASDTGDVIGPVLKEESYFLYKVLEKDTRPDSVNVAHILLGRSVRGKTDSLMRVADSLKKELKGGAKFSPMAERISEDPNSARKGGSLGWIRPGDMLPAFDSASFHADSGAYPIVKTRAGIHLIHVRNRTKPVPQYRTAKIEDEVEASEATLDSAFKKAQNLSIESHDLSSFQKKVEEKGLQVRLASRVRESDRSVARLENSRNLVRWAYNAKKGNVSQAKRCGDHYVVAVLTEVRKDGAPSFANVRDEMRSEVVQNKKAKRFIKEMKGSNNLDSLASAYGLKVRSASGIDFKSNSLPGGGNEPFVIGKLLSVTQADVYTKPIKGNAGVYVALVTDLKKAGKPGKADLARLQRQIQRRRESWVQKELFNILKDHAEVEDKRNTLR